MSGTPKTPEDVIAWKAPDGPVTILEVDAVRSVANCLLKTLSSDRPGQIIRGYMLGLARDTDANIAMMVHEGRKVRKAAGDEPVLASFDVPGKTDLDALHARAHKDWEKESAELPRGDERVADYQTFIYAFGRGYLGALGQVRTGSRKTGGS